METLKFSQEEIEQFQLASDALGISLNHLVEIITGALEIALPYFPPRKSEDQ